MGVDADAKEPDPRVVPGGYLTHDGVFVAEAEVRVSPDGRFHICRQSGALTGGVIKPSSRPLCMWVPGRGS